MTLLVARAGARATLTLAWLTCVLAAAACADDADPQGKGSGGATGSGGDGGGTPGVSSGASSSRAATASSGEGGQTASSSDGSSGISSTATTTQSSATSTGSGGAPGCVEITVDGTDPDFSIPFHFSVPFTPTLGDPEVPDQLGVFYQAGSGDYEMYVGDELYDCANCIVVLEDGEYAETAPRVFAPTSGTMSVTEAHGFPHATVALTDVVLIEVAVEEPFSALVPVPDGMCLTIASAQLDYAVPFEWTCSALDYGDGERCDCDCGAADPDCADLQLPIYNCGPPHSRSAEGGECGSSGDCVSPAAWVCSSSEFASGDGCQCGCGTPDPDCELGIDPPKPNCAGNEVCRYDACLAIPATWSCDVDRYASHDGCDCACGAYDPDCDEPGVVLGCADDEGCAADGQCGVSATWACDPLAFADGSLCECGCGARDPDCATSSILVGCVGDDVCGDDGVCHAIAPNDLCAAAVPLPLGDSTGTWVGAGNDLDPGPDGCTGAAAAGSEVFFTVSLLAGQTLTVESHDRFGPSDTALYLVTDCLDATTCVRGLDMPVNEVQILSYTASVDVDLVLVVDRAVDTAQETFGFSTTIE